MPGPQWPHPLENASPLPPRGPGRGPLLYHVLIAGERGQAVPGGFTAATDLGTADLRAAHSGRRSNDGNLSHIPRTIVISDGKGSSAAEVDIHLLR